MSEDWYSIATPEARITQGDLIRSCPLIGWKENQAELTGGDETEVLRHSTEAFLMDAVVMTQACDLEHEKVSNVVLCPHYSLTEYRSLWEEACKESQQNPTSKAWRSHCEDIRDGLVWTLALLNALPEGEVTTDYRVVDFHEVFTVPRAFLESLLKARQLPRLRLSPPYREHLSQAFARFFMRVGLPVSISKAW